MTKQDTRRLIENEISAIDEELKRSRDMKRGFNGSNAERRIVLWGACVFALAMLIPMTLVSLAGGFTDRTVYVLGFGLQFLLIVCTERWAKANRDLYR